MIRPFDFAGVNMFTQWSEVEEPKGAKTVSPKKRENTSSTLSPTKAKQLRLAPPSQPVAIRQQTQARRKIALLDDSSSSVDPKQFNALNLDPFKAIADKIDKLSKQFHRFTPSDIDNIVIEIDDALSNEKRKGLQVITNTNSPCVILFNHDESTGYILPTEKHPGIKPFSRLLSVSNAIKLTWKNTSDASKKAYSFELEKVSQQTPLPSLPAHLVKTFLPFEIRHRAYIRENSDLKYIFPKSYDILDYTHAGVHKSIHVTTCYPRSIQEFLANNKYIYGDVLFTFLPLLKELAVLHSHEIIHGDICLHKIMVDKYSNPKLTGFEYAYKKDGNGPSWEKGFYGSQFDLAPELRNGDHLTRLDLTKMDVFAVGSVLQQLLAEIDIREGLNKLPSQENITEAQRNLLEDRAICQTFIDNLQNPNFQQRFSSIQAHNFIIALRDVE